MGGRKSRRSREKERTRIDALRRDRESMRHSKEPERVQTAGLGTRRRNRADANLRRRHEWTRRRGAATLKGPGPGDLHLTALEPVRK